MRTQRRQARTRLMIEAVSGLSPEERRRMFLFLFLSALTSVVLQVAALAAAGAAVRRAWPTRGGDPFDTARVLSDRRLLAVLATALGHALVRSRLVRRLRRRLVGSAWDRAGLPDGP